MAIVAEGIARVTSGIAAGRRQRSELAMGINAATSSRRVEVRSLLADLKASRGHASRERAEKARKVTSARHGDVRSLLASLKASRGKMGREQATEAKRATKARHGEVHSLLHGLKTSRGGAARDYRREATIAIGGRRSEVKALLTHFWRERVANRKHRQTLAAAQHDEAAAFMRDLTRGVATLRDNFAKEGRDRAAEIRERLAAYARDRQDAVAIWRAGLRQGQQVAAHHAEPSVPASSSIPAHEDAVDATQSSEAAAGSGRRPFGNLGRRGSSESHGDSK